MKQRHLTKLGYTVIGVSDRGSVKSKLKITKRIGNEKWLLLSSTGRMVACRADGNTDFCCLFFLQIVTNPSFLVGSF